MTCENTRAATRQINKSLERLWAVTAYFVKRRTDFMQYAATYRTPNHFTAATVWDFSWPDGFSWGGAPGPIISSFHMVHCQCPSAELAANVANCYVITMSPPPLASPPSHPFYRVTTSTEPVSFPPRVMWNMSYKQAVYKWAHILIYCHFPECRAVILREAWQIFLCLFVGNLHCLLASCRSVPCSVRLATVSADQINQREKSSASPPPPNRGPSPKHESTVLQVKSSLSHVSLFYPACCWLSMSLFSSAAVAPALRMSCVRRQCVCADTQHSGWLEGKCVCPDTRLHSAVCVVVARLPFCWGHFLVWNKVWVESCDRTCYSQNVLI